MFTPLHTEMNKAMSLFTCALIFIFAQGANCQTVSPKFKFTETFCEENISYFEQDKRIPEFVQTSKLVIEFEIPIDSEIRKQVGKDTPFVVQAGGYTFYALFGSDESLSPENSLLLLIHKTPADPFNIVKIKGKASLKWREKSIFVKITSRVQDNNLALASQSFTNSDDGSVHAEADVKVEIGKHIVNFQIHIDGKVKRNSFKNENESHSITNINLHGEIKKKRVSSFNQTKV